MKKIRVLVVDDSSTMRGLISSALARDPEIEVVGEAADPLQARQAIKTLNPDVVTLDVEMPNMSGLEFLEKIMRLRPMPVIMVSTLTSRGAEETIKALEIGAVDCIEKPRPGNEHNFEELPFKVKIAASARVRPLLRDDNQKHAADARRSHEDYQSDGRVLATREQFFGDEQEDERHRHQQTENVFGFHGENVILPGHPGKPRACRPEGISFVIMVPCNDACCWSP